MSDEVQTGDLLRFDESSGLKPIDTSQFSYANSLDAMKKIEKDLGDKSTSLYSKNGNQSTQDLYKSPSYKELYGSSSTTTKSSSK